jgi:tetratricopeptide (TPR) repeat protein
MDETRSLFSEGKRAFQQHQYEHAKKIFLKLIQLNLHFADVYNMLGVISHNSGQFEDAVKYFDKALKINPHYTEALLNLAVLYNDLGKYKKARTLYAKVQSKSRDRHGNKMNPFIRAKLANRHADLGDLYEGIGFFKEAVEEYQKALKLGPTFIDIHCKLAICLREMGKYKESIQAFKKALKANARYHYASVQLGVTLYASGKVKEAIAQWKKTLKSQPYNEGARMYLRLAEGN